ncbi:MAG: TonB family protein, partial [Sphingomonadales bacterium]
PPGNWVTPDDYPVEAIRADEHGVVGFRLTIAADGSVGDCEIVASAGETLDRETCVLLRQRARFTPARDAKGVPVASRWASSIRWQFPEDPPIPWTNWDVMATLDLDAKGVTLSCTSKISGIADSAIGDPCEGHPVGQPSGVLDGIMPPTGKAERLVLETFIEIADGASYVTANRPKGTTAMKIMAITFEVSSAGVAENCHLLVDGTEIGDTGACANFPVKFLPAEGPDGMPRQRRGKLTMALSRAQ